MARSRRRGVISATRNFPHQISDNVTKPGWLMERIAAEPEVTVRGLMTELAERGVAVSYGTVWNFIARE